MKSSHRQRLETCAQAEEILGINIEMRDLAGRLTLVKAKGARPHTSRRGLRAIAPFTASADATRERGRLAVMCAGTLIRQRRFPAARACVRSGSCDSRAALACGAAL